MARKRRYEHPNPYVRSAQKRIRQKKRFYRHLKSYLIVNTMMSLLIFFDSGSSKDWMPVWILWGIGLAFQYFNTFGFFGIGRLDEEWERRELEKELQRRGMDPAKVIDTEDELDLEEFRRRRAEPEIEPEELPGKKYREEDLL